ncbi:MAG: universal stress protein [Cyanobacteria bacterium NC_groundwater_1444_Ag_S-0.65um_54_12]|nr:universal stress protein [Cyanobacteria bacterium NC_groundwater_1444_Ag_S-0.65um_54_12]
MTVPTILVPLDGSLAALAALPVAQGLASLLQATLQILHVLEQPLSPRELIEKLRLDSEQLTAVLEQASGLPAPTILQAAIAKQSDYLVLCTRTGLAGPADLFGPVTWEILPKSPCPVILVRPQRGSAPWQLRKLLLPHNGTPTTAAAIEPAAKLARLSGAQLDVIHITAPGIPVSQEPGTLTVPRYIDQPHHEWPAWTGEFLDRLCCIGCLPEQLKLRLFHRTGEPGAEIVQHAGQQGSDLIVLAWHGELAAEHAATLKSVILTTPCPLLLLRIP